MGNKQAVSQDAPNAAVKYDQFGNKIGSGSNAPPVRNIRPSAPQLVDGPQRVQSKLRATAPAYLPAQPQPQQSQPQQSQPQQSQSKPIPPPLVKEIIGEMDADTDARLDEIMNNGPPEEKIADEPIGPVRQSDGTKPSFLQRIFGASDVAEFIEHARFEHQHRYRSVLASVNIEDVCRSAADGELSRALRENYNLLMEEDAFTPKYLYSSHPMGDTKLSASEVYVGYKMARFAVGKSLSTQVAVLLTLHIPALSTHVRASTSGDLIQPTAYGMYDATEYCTGRAIVAGIQFLGNIHGCSIAFDTFISGGGKIISNFDPNFLYTLGHELNEPEFGMRGIGCMKGIHFFKDKKSAIKYSNKGFIATEVTTPVISCVVSEMRDVDDPDVTYMMEMFKRQRDQRAAMIAAAPAPSSMEIAGPPGGPSVSGVSGMNSGVMVDMSTMPELKEPVLEYRPEPRRASDVMTYIDHFPALAGASARGGSSAGGSTSMEAMMLNTFGPWFVKHNQMFVTN